MPDARRINFPGDYYRVLGVREDASAHEIRRAYWRLARLHHPDVSDQTGAADRFQTVSEAYQVLHDPATRARYDHHARKPPVREGPVNSRPDTASRSPDPGYTHDGYTFRADRFARLLGRWQVVAPGIGGEAILELSAQEATLAATTAVTLTDSRGNTIELPPGIRHGQRFWIRGARGRTQPGGSPGDLLVLVQVASDPHHDPYLT